MYSFPLKYLNLAACPDGSNTIVTAECEVYNVSLACVHCAKNLHSCDYATSTEHVQCYE